MSILGKYTDNTTDTEENIGKEYVPPAVIRKDKDELNFKKALVISTALHPGTALIAWLITVILALFGINLALFEKPKPKMNDIEFVLVDKEDTPINKNTKYRADINSRAGGHHDPKKRVSMPSPPPGTPQKTKAAAPAAKSTPAAQPQKQNPIQKAIQQAAQPAKPAKQQSTEGPKAPEQAKPQPPTARPSLKPPTTPKVATAPTSAFTVPVPKGGSGSGSYSTGPISGSGSSSSGGGSSGSSSSGSGAPSPSLAPTGGGSSSGSKLAKGGGGGTGGGNPGPGNPNGRPGIDTIREPDFGPYMRELQRRIKTNWEPPKGNESKRVVLTFKIAKDGRLLSCSVFKSSGLPGADNAALNAVRASAPYRPLPAEFKGASVDIQFTFDYNVFGVGGYN